MMRLALWLILAVMGVYPYPLDHFSGASQETSSEETGDMWDNYYYYDPVEE